MLAIHWLDYVAESEGLEIEHDLNTGRELRVEGLLLEDYCRAERLILEYNGCWVHVHDHVIDAILDPELKQKLIDQRERTAKKVAMLERRFTV